MIVICNHANDLFYLFEDNSKCADKMGNITKEPSYCGHKAYGIPLILQGVGNFSALLEQLDVNCFVH